MSPLLVVPADAVPFAAVDAVIAVPAQDPEPPPGKGEEFGKASPIALVVIILLALVTVLLIRGMTRRIRRLPASFDQAADEAGDGAAAPGEQPAEQRAANGARRDAAGDSEEAGPGGS